jgi:hypothetical protein
MIQAQVETKELSEAMRRYAKATGKSAGQVVKMNCKFMAKSLMVSTQPRSHQSGGDGDFRKKKGEVIYHGKADRKLGEASVTKDIGKVFSTFSQTFEEIKENSEDAAKGFFKAAKSGDWREAERILRSTGISNRNANVGKLDRAIHKQSKHNGRVNRQRAELVVDNKERKEYTKEIVKRVGFAKAAWANAGLSFGPMTNVPAFIKRHAAPSTTVNNTSRETDPYGEMQSLVRYAGQVLKDDSVTIALRIATGRMERMMEHELAYLARKQGMQGKTTAESQPIE